MKTIAIYIIIAAAAFWAAQDGRNAPASVPQERSLITADERPFVVHGGGAGTASEMIVNIPGGGAGGPILTYKGQGEGGGGGGTYAHEGPHGGASGTVFILEDR